MRRRWRILALGIGLLTACTSGGTGANPGPRHTSANVSPSPAATASDAPPLPAKALPVAPRPTPGTVFSLRNAPLEAGGGVSIGLHPTEAPITLRASASMPLTVCPDGDSAIGTGLSWPFARFTECMLLRQDEWVQMPSSHTNAYHLGFRIRAAQDGTIHALTVSYQRVDPAFFVVTNPATMLAMTATFTPAGNSAAATLYYDSNQNARSSVINLTQAGSSHHRTGACTFLSEATTCFLGLSPGREVTVRVLRAPDAKALVLDLTWP